MTEILVQHWYGRILFIDKSTNAEVRVYGESIEKPVSTQFNPFTKSEPIGDCDD